MTFRFFGLWLVSMTTLVLGACTPASNAPEFDTSELLPGGGATASRLQTRSYVFPGGHIKGMEQLDFWTGFSLFRDPWVIAPSSTRDRDGLGPLFNTRSCISCHHAGGRGPMAEEGISKPSSLLLRLGSTDPAQRKVDSQYGGQIQPRSIDPSVVAEAKLDLRYKMVNGQFADGETYTLRQPEYRLVELSQGPLDPDIGISPRFAPNIYGMGLLDAIPEASLLALEDVDDRDQDGISGRYNRVPEQRSGEIQIGRYGFKARHPSLAQQVAAAFQGDIGITSSGFNEESCTEKQPQCTKVASWGGHQGVEIPDKLLALVIEFNQHLAVPPARNLGSHKVQAGRKLFYQLDCQGCHTPSHTTDTEYTVPSLRGHKIWPYTDLALHDMGSGLADGVFEFDANGQEWRTPPLWGIGLQKKILNREHFLHDGRARSLEEAVLWHGGEAAVSQQKYTQLDKQQRDQLLAFLQAI